MDLRKALLKEHTRAQASKIADYVGYSKALFKDLVEVYLAGPYRITQRAAWPVSICVERYPHLLMPHLSKILGLLEKPGVHNAVKRNTMRLLQFVDIPKGYHGKVAALCFHYIQDSKEATAVKAFSMTVLSHISQAEPDLKRELKMIIEHQLPYSSPGFVARARKVMKELNNEL